MFGDPNLVIPPDQNPYRHAPEVAKEAADKVKEVIAGGADAVKDVIRAGVDVIKNVAEAKRRAEVEHYITESKGKFGEELRQYAEEADEYLIRSGLDVDKRKEFFKLGLRVRAQFPDSKRIARGFLSAAEDMVNPREDIFVPSEGIKGKKIRNRTAERGYDAHKLLKTLKEIAEKEERQSRQRTLLFTEPYKPREHSAKEINNFITGVFDGLEYPDTAGLEDPRVKKAIEITRKLESGKDLKKSDLAVLHDLLLPVYLRARYDGQIEKIIVGNTISTFLNLDPDFQTGRCTAGNGIFRKHSYKYALYDDVAIIDLCVGNQENKVAEVMIVDTNDEKGKKYLVVETAEAGMGAYVLPEYEGMPLWACLLVEEIIERIDESYSGIVFSTNVDTKPGPNNFLTTAAKLLGFSKTPGQEAYSPLYRPPLRIDEFCTTRPWRDRKGTDKKYLEKTDDPVKKRTVRRNAFLGPGEYALVEEEIMVQGTIKGTGLFPETYLGAWGSRDNFEHPLLYWLLEKIGLARYGSPLPPFSFRDNPNINNGKGYVRGLVYEPTEESYKTFKEKMVGIKQAVGLAE